MVFILGFILSYNWEYYMHFSEVRRWTAEFQPNLPGLRLVKTLSCVSLGESYCVTNALIEGTDAQGKTTAFK